MVRIPYGISNFENLRREGFYYLDRTNFIEKIEQEDRHFLFFLRPRRFGKSLFVSMLEYYYGIEHKDKFERLFDGTYIGDSPTSKANSYLVLNFNFSGINTDSYSNIEDAFNDRVYLSIKVFLETYKGLIDINLEHLPKNQSGSKTLNYLLSILKVKNLPPVYILIDEYDHFTNELLSFNLTYYRNAVSSNGYIRKFYEVVKIGTGTGVVGRLFVTGVAPVTLDSMTSGFNIGSNISMNGGFHDMMGMRKEEVQELLLKIGLSKVNLSDTIADLSNWYNGYKFSEDANNKLFNTNLVLYYASHYNETQKPPKQLIDSNLATDYKKVGNLFNISPDDTNSREVLQALVNKETIDSELVTMFEMGRRWYQKDLVSLLYWMGFLTIDQSSLMGYKLTIPNFVMESLYRDFFLEKLIEAKLYGNDPKDITKAIIAIATEANLRPFIKIVAEILHNLSTRDQRHFNEMSLKAIFVTLLFQQKFYLTRTELEVKKSVMGKKGFVDVYCQTLPNFDTKYDVVFELKQASTKDSKSIQDLLEEGRKQIQNYVSDPIFKKQDRETLFFVVACKGSEVEFQNL